MNDADVLVEAVLASGVVLPAPPGGFLRLQAAAANEDAGPRELAAAVSTDPAITGALLRVANSPVFRPRNPVGSVQEAIAMLGRTRSLAIATSTALRGQSADLDGRAIEAIWSASASAAECAFRACRALPCKALADTVYLAALLQDAGIAVLLKRSPRWAPLFHAKASPESRARQLDVRTASDHGAAGYLVARNWRLPTEVCEAIRAHHDPALALRLADGPRRIALLLAVGRRLRDGDSPDWADWARPVEEAFGLDPEALAALEDSR
ncbi:MAG: HDOD domain-containing protein [Rhodocyclaceae bacterium]|jgi:HD-like signal output (HDOD) protein|nr:HDOD domain-containing protein [Rhodocyclaceae bacterium]